MYQNIILAPFFEIGKKLINTKKKIIQNLSRVKKIHSILIKLIHDIFGRFIITNSTRSNGNSKTGRGRIISNHIHDHHRYERMRERARQKDEKLHKHT